MAAAAGKKLDEFYTYDGVYQLANLDRGDLNPGKTGISGVPDWEEDFGLDATGNWTGYVQKTSGNTDLDQSRTHNKVNEITDITETVGDVWITPTHDACGKREQAHGWARCADSFAVAICRPRGIEAVPETCSMLASSTCKMRADRADVSDQQERAIDGPASRPGRGRTALGITHDIDDYLGRMRAELERVDRHQVRRFAKAIYEAWENGRFIFVFGNGGSGATASHFSEDLGKNALREVDLDDDSKQRPRVISLADNTSWITALGNDVGFDQIFIQQLRQYGRPGDLAVAISVSGNSPNVLAAAEWANRRGLKTFGLSGYDGGRLKQVQQDGLHIALDDMGMA